MLLKNNICKQHLISGKQQRYKGRGCSFSAPVEPFDPIDDQPIMNESRRMIQQMVNLNNERLHYNVAGSHGVRVRLSSNAILLAEADNIFKYRRNHKDLRNSPHFMVRRRYYLHVDGLEDALIANVKTRMIELSNASETATTVEEDDAH